MPHIDLRRYLHIGDFFGEGSVSQSPSDDGKAMCNRSHCRYHMLIDVINDVRE